MVPPHGMARLNLSEVSAPSAAVPQKPQQVVGDLSAVRGHALEPQESGDCSSSQIILGLYWCYIGIMENKMETTTMGLYRDYRV